MSGEQKRRDGVEHLKVDGVAFRHVLALASDRKARLLGLREMVQQGGTEFVEAVARHGEIERMSKDYREALLQERTPAAVVDQLGFEFEAVLVEIRTRAETGRLRISKRQNGAGKLADVAGGDQQPLGESSADEGKKTLSGAREQQRVDIAKPVDGCGADDGRHHSDAAATAADEEDAASTLSAELSPDRGYGVGDDEWTAETGEGTAATAADIDGSDEDDRDLQSQERSYAR